MKTLLLRPKTEAPIMEQIKEISKHGTVLCFAGVGAAWSRKNANTSLIIAKDGKTVLVDLGRNVPESLEAQGIDWLDFDYYHFTHSHADHVGAAEELMLKMRYLKQRKVKIIITHEYQQTLWNETLKGGAEINEVGLLRFTDLFEVVRPNWVAGQPREKYHVKLDGILDLTLFRTFHVPGGVNNWEKAFWSTGLEIDGKAIFTADTRYDESLFNHLNFDNVEAIFHDCQLGGPGTVHATYEELSKVMPTYKNRMMLTHYGDNFEKFDPKNDGFIGFAKPWEVYLF